MLENNRQEEQEELKVPAEPVGANPVVIEESKEAERRGIGQSN